jgi:flagellar protein FlaG
MAFGRTAAEIIFFIATVIVASAVAGGFMLRTSEFAQVFKQQGNLLKERISHEIEIINDPSMIPKVKYEGDYYYVFYVKNIGKGNILFTKNTVGIYIDGYRIDEKNLRMRRTGEIKEGGTTEVLIDSSHWLLKPGEHKIEIILENGIKDTLDFIIK